MTQIIKTRLQLRRFTAAQWTANNEVLLDQEPGMELDTGLGKIGDGVTHWNDLSYTIVGLGAIDLSDLAAGKVIARNAGNDGWEVVDNGGGGGSGSSASVAAFDTAIMALSPVAYWKCDEASGTTLADSSGNGYDLTLTGDYILSFGRTFPLSTSRLGVYFYPGTSASPNAASRSGALGMTVPLVGDYTMAAVVIKLSNAGNFFSIAGSGETEAVNVQAYLNCNNTQGNLDVFWETGNGGNVDFEPFLPMPYLVPCFVVGRKDAVNKRVDMFINGIRVYRASYSSEPTGGTSVTTDIGGLTNGTVAGGCVSGSTAFFDSALTDDQIYALAKAGGFAA